MNTIQRIMHPRTFAEANQKLIEQNDKGTESSRWTDMHLDLLPKGIVHAENVYSGFQAHRKGVEDVVVGCVYHAVWRRGWPQEVTG